MTGKRTEYYKVSYSDGEYFIVKGKAIVFSNVDKQFKRLQIGNKISGSPKSYGITREKISKTDAQMEIMLG